ncbi:MAG: NADH-quinone oxidoreductase subunit L [Gemmatimonadales bacterium]|nr:NADH-quinone oxidoreductase subunit L [Gemmatimonadales bacterium]
MPVHLVWLTVAFPLLGFLVNGALAFARPNARRAVSVAGVGSLVASFVVSLGIFLTVRSAHIVEPEIVKLWAWLPVDRFHIDIAFQVDPLAAVMLLVVTGVGSLIHLFSVGYMQEDAGYARYFAYLNLFIVFMLVLVLGSSLPVLFIGWEGVGLCSYLLIGFWFSDTANASAGKKAFLMNRIGDFGVLIAMFQLWTTLGTLEFVGIAREAPRLLQPGGTAVTLITLFLFLGCTGKSAQIPLYTWLPDAMAGPTPVSALIHAATMVTAGVYLVARTNVLFAMAPATSTLIAGVGALTALFAASIGLRQYDIKKVLAYSTVSQLGYMFVGVGTGVFVSGLFHLVTHAFFKALLFLGAGSVIHAMHHAYHASHSHDDAQDMRNMGGLRSYLPKTWVLMWIATLAIAGVPPFSGFFSKDEILTAAFVRGADNPWYYLFYAMGLAAAFATAFYMARLMVMTFHGENRSGAAAREHLHEPGAIMTGPLIVLGVLSALGGILNVPAALGGHHALAGWLRPVFAPSAGYLQVEELRGSTEYLLIAAAVLAGVAGLVLGYRATLNSRLLPAREALPDTGFARVLANKYYVDEAYDRVIVRPVVGFSRSVLWRFFDQGLVDGLLVNGSARLFRGVGWLGSQLQTGQVGFYVLFFAVGAVWILHVLLG